MREYYIFDPLDELEPSFQGYALRDNRLEPLPALPSGGRMSPLLGAELRPMAMAATDMRPPATYLRLIDPRTDDPVLVPEEAYQNFDDVSREYANASRDIRAAEARADAEVRTRQEAQRRADDMQRWAEAEAHMRGIMEEQAARLQEALRAARAQLAQLQGGDGAPTDRDT